MRTQILGLSAIFVVALAMMPGEASSHREAPLLAQDPMADNTDVYAFVSPDAPDTVTLIANFIPFQKPDGGPNFYSFDPNVVYEIHIDNNGDAVEDITYQWRFTTEVRNPATFLYNTGTVTSLDDPDLNVRQFYRLTRIDGPRRTGTVTELSGRLPVPPPNIGPRSTPNYGATGRRHPVAAGQRHACLPASATRASTSTSASSICSASARAASKTAPPASTSARSRFACRSRRWRAAARRRRAPPIRTRSSACGPRRAASRRARCRPARRRTAARSCRCRVSAIRSSTKR